MLFSLSLSVLLASILSVVALIRWVHARFFSRHSLSHTLPWAGEGKRSFFSLPLATIRSLSDTRSLLAEGYEKHSKFGNTFVLPNIISGPEVIIPPQMMEWLLQQPDNVLDQAEVNREFLQADYTMLHKKVVHDSVHIDVIRNELGKGVGRFTGDVLEEIDVAFRSAWGIDTKEWNTITVYDAMSEIIARISNRVLVGLPLCRDEEYLYHSSRFSRWVVLCSSAISLFPEALKPFVAPIITISDYRHFLRMAKHIIPIWKRRTSAPLQDDKQKSDYVQWSLDHADDKRDPEERSCDMISKRLAALTFAAIQSSVITSANLLFDLAASDITPTLFEHIRKEIYTELDAENGAWTKASLSRMVVLDSALRESMRLGGFVSRGVLKTVVAKKGIQLPDLQGTHLPYGTKVGIAAFPVHYDENIYPEANKFKPLRFCQIGGGKVGAAGTSNKGTSLVTSSPTFMGFSHGRHACPGRFFASQQLKLALAYIATNYELHPIAERPANNWLVGSSGPPLKETMMIRRREGTV